MAIYVSDSWRHLSTIRTDGSSTWRGKKNPKKERRHNNNNLKKKDGEYLKRMRRAREQKSQIARVPSRRWAGACFRVYTWQSRNVVATKGETTKDQRGACLFHSRVCILIRLDGIDILHSSRSILFFFGSCRVRVFANLEPCLPDTPLIRQAGSQEGLLYHGHSTRQRRSSARPTFQFDTRQNKKNRTSSRVEWNLAG